MWSRLLRIFLLQFWLFWVLLVMPAHTRGAIPVNAAASHSTNLFFSSLPACCSDKSEKSDKSSPRPPVNCAICQIISHTTITPKIPTLDQRMELIRWIDPVPAKQIAAEKFLLRTRSRAPPFLFA